MNSVRLELALRAVIAISMGIAVVALVWRPSVPMLEVAPAGVDFPPITRPLSTIDPAAGQTIVAADIFSASRTAPAVRYNPVDPDAGNVPDPSPITEDQAVPQLYGTVVGPRGASALMRLDAGTTGAQLYREGDRGGTYRVEEIDEQSVVLSGPEGRIVVRLVHP
ncbi:MAG: hypothetical protein EXR92_03055 [Gemmatimonadetes bacterium]|nr:hypothetical protein [Gemmatimonadota bacterium]